MQKKEDLRKLVKSYLEYHYSMKALNLYDYAYGKYLESCNLDRALILWDVETGKHIKKKINRTPWGKI